jgi:hypothetical protein
MVEDTLTVLLGEDSRTTLDLVIVEHRVVDRSSLEEVEVSNHASEHSLQIETGRSVA